MKVTASIGIVATCLFLAACEKHAESTAGTTTPEAAAASIAHTGSSITAAPNPVPAVSGAGTTTIKWTTGDGTNRKRFRLGNWS